MTYAKTLSMLTESAGGRTTSNPRSYSLPEQVALDLANYLDNFPNKNFGIRILAGETGINERTIKRLLTKQNHPSYQTLIKFYTVFTEKLDVEQLLNACPEVVRNEIQDKCPDKQAGQKHCKVNFLEMIQNDPLLGELYVLAGTGPLYKDSVVFRYGQYGLELVERLHKAGLLTMTDKNTYTLSKANISIDGSVIKELGTRFIKRYCKPNEAKIRGNNIMNFYAEGLNDEGMQAWMKIDEESFYKKLQIANNPEYRGSQPVFTFTATDTVELEKRND